MTKEAKAFSENLNFKKLKQMYLFALITIAITVLLSQLLIQHNINSQINDSRLINISGKQRMLSQKLAKEILILNSFSDDSNEKENVSNIKKTLGLWKFTHLALEKGNDSLNFPETKSQHLLELFNAVKPNVDYIDNATKKYLIDRDKHVSQTISQQEVQGILDNVALFVTKMNMIVSQYEYEALEKVTKQRNIEYGILSFTLLILFLEFLFIFKPTNKKIEILISKLLSSERRAIKLARDTEAISVIKENSVKELKSLNFAMENTLLYCRISPQGKIIHMGDKFAKLLQYNASFDADKSFSKALTAVEKEQLEIDRIIADKQRSGWQGELNTTTRNGDPLWLDMSMIPVRIRKQESEILVICFNISIRKKAEIEIERLNRENTIEKINQQKIISSRIVENQENEQNRIAREIHDGIGQMLTGLKFSLESINLDDKEKSAQKIEYLKKLSLDIIKGVRTATFNLMPPELTDHGIVSSIAKLTLELTKLTGKNIQFYNKTDFDQRLDSLIEINIYRLTQEAINNAIKYAESSHIIVQLSHSNKILSINVDDNGKGFDIATVEKKRNSESGMGLLFMKERIQYINGRAFINSIPGEGTRITFNIPI
ncbi:ATP-binding protein [Flavobacterium undicola]|uniref:ATP-binding protein n=1 Tax=Flavobacterium undicola TaxID=1932779 RepID=UPI001376987B|nr:ATP-binding protein [Flavobacterium undicola]MBA0885206.1 type IV pili methyl-accepting chemotaxis transducer N-terminal domain-containing protein [Flavobacterium undicola]